MNATTRTIAPVIGVIFLFAVAHSIVAQTSVEASRDPAVTGSMAPFEYFPAQYVSQAAESGEHIPTF